jgi:hypothetical protein
MKKANQPKPAPHPELVAILDRAVEAGADAVEFEYASGGGLEVTSMSGNTGMGELLRDRDLERTLMTSIIKSTGVRASRRGRMTTTLRGHEYTIFAESYDSFGETAFRLTFKKAGGREDKRQGQAS